MMTLSVWIERNETMIPVGSISGNDSSDSQFQYSPDYLKDPAASAISISLPLKEQSYSPAQTANFFEGLLPEGFTRRSVAQWLHVDEGDYLSILSALGRECLGAICITEESETQEASYELVSERQVQELAAEGAAKSVELVTKSHLSLTGATGKVGLYYAEHENAWYLPHGTAPSTHIVKQSHVRLDAIVTNEQLSMMTAKRCGISIPNSFIINTGRGAEHEVLFATQRFDRVLPDDPCLVSGLPRPLRLHQEDFAQALGIPASAKYEREPKDYMKRMFDLLRKYSSDPITDQLQLWDTIVFDFLIGNTDAHIKNFSLLYSPDLRSIRLAPVYDIISTTVYDQSTRDMAFHIGGDLSIDSITEDSFRRAAKEIGLGVRMAMRRFESIRNQFRSSLRQSAEELAAAGYSKALEKEQQILQSGGFGKIK
jgi:serine/threonine-protein kinase HipA